MNDLEIRREIAAKLTRATRTMRRGPGELLRPVSIEEALDDIMDTIAMLADLKLVNYGCGDGSEFLLREEVRDEQA